MRKKALITICSREKSEEKGLLPAVERYTSERIEKVFQEAREKELMFFVLSGEFGLLAADDKIPYYDHLLREEEVAELVPKVSKRLQENQISEIEFFTKLGSENWEPYNELMKEAAGAAGVELKLVGLDQ